MASCEIELVQGDRRVLYSFPPTQETESTKIVVPAGVPFELVTHPFSQAASSDWGQKHDNYPFHAVAEEALFSWARQRMNWRSLLALHEDIAFVYTGDVLLNYCIRFTMSIWRSGEKQEMVLLMMRNADTRTATKLFLLYVVWAPGVVALACSAEIVLNWLQDMIDKIEEWKKTLCAIDTLQFVSGLFAAACLASDRDNEILSMMQFGESTFHDGMVSVVDNDMYQPPDGFSSGDRYMNLGMLLLSSSITEENLPVVRDSIMGILAGAGFEDKADAWNEMVCSARAKLSVPGIDDRCRRSLKYKRDTIWVVDVCDVACSTWGVCIAQTCTRQRRWDSNMYRTLSLCGHVIKKKLEA